MFSIFNDLFWEAVDPPLLANVCLASWNGTAWVHPYTESNRYIVLISQFDASSYRPGVCEISFNNATSSVTNGGGVSVQASLVYSGTLVDEITDYDGLVYIGGGSDYASGFTALTEFTLPVALDYVDAIGEFDRILLKIDLMYTSGLITDIQFDLPLGTPEYWTGYRGTMEI